MISAHLQSKNRILLVCKLTFNHTNRNTAYKIFLYKRIDQNNWTDGGDTGRHLDSLRWYAPRRLCDRVDIGGGA